MSMLGIHLLICLMCGFETIIEITLMIILIHGHVSFDHTGIIEDFIWWVRTMFLLWKFAKALKSCNSLLLVPSNYFS